MVDRLRVFFFNEGEGQVVLSHHMAGLECLRVEAHQAKTVLWKDVTVLQFLSVTWRLVLLRVGVLRTQGQGCGRGRLGEESTTTTTLLLV